MKELLSCVRIICVTNIAVVACKIKKKKRKEKGEKIKNKIKSFS